MTTLWVAANAVGKKRLGEGSGELVCKGHRVSCLVPTSGGSGRGVNFGDF